MIIKKLINMIRRDPPAHQVPQVLRDLDHVIQFVVNEQQEVAAPAKARATSLANSGQPSVAGLASACRSRSTVALKHLTSLRVALPVGACVVLAGIYALIASAPHMVPAHNLNNVVPGIVARPQTDTWDSKEIVRFTLTVTARGSGNVHYILRPDNPSQPETGDTMTFNGPTQTTQTTQTTYVDYPVSHGGSQPPSNGMTVEIISPDSSRRSVIHGQCGPVCLWTAKERK